MRLQATIILSLFFCISIQAKIIHLGSGYALTSPNQLQGILKPGDTVLIHIGTYTGTFFLSDIQGTANSPIVIKAASGESVILSGGTESFHFSDVSHLVVSDFIIEKQSGNGMNIDDGGSFATPSHHITIQNCTFRNINASGNNDLLKLSGIDDFIVQDCIFQKGAAGGSGIDMVGCHRGYFIRNQFTDLGSNSIQIKGGSEQITITQNKFVNGGARALNIGGSTGLEFFRPLNATFEANRVIVYANIFEGSEAPFAFVGAVNSIVYNNTIIRPGRWVMRILQETVDANRFQASGKDSVINNIFILNANVITEVNIGPNTTPNSFYFSNNLWYKENQSSWQGPSLPTFDVKQIVSNPNINTNNYKITNQSAAYLKGTMVFTGSKDYYNKIFANPPSIGAVEADNTTSIITASADELKVYPNPVSDILYLNVKKKGNYLISDIHGTVLIRGTFIEGINRINVQSFADGVYFIQDISQGSISVKWFKIDK